MKKFLAMALSLAMVLSLAACGSKNETPADCTDTPAENTDTADNTESTEVSLVNPGKLTVATSPDFAPYEFYSIDASWQASTWLWPVTLPTTWAWSWTSSPWTLTAC